MAGHGRHPVLVVGELMDWSRLAHLIPLRELGPGDWIALALVAGIVIGALVMMARDRFLDRRAQAQSAAARKAQRDLEQAERLRNLTGPDADGRWDWSADREFRRVSREVQKETELRQRNVERDDHGNALLEELDRRRAEEAERMLQVQAEEAEAERQRKAREAAQVMAAQEPSYTPGMEPSPLQKEDR